MVKHYLFIEFEFNLNKSDVGGLVKLQFSYTSILNCQEMASLLLFLKTIQANRHFLLFQEAISY